MAAPLPVTLTLCNRCCLYWLSLDLRLFHCLHHVTGGGSGACECRDHQSQRFVGQDLLPRLPHPLLGARQCIHSWDLSSSVEITPGISTSSSSKDPLSPGISAGVCVSDETSMSIGENKLLRLVAAQCVHIVRSPYPAWE